MKTFFLHIPKTGGQTIARRLASAHRPAQCHLLKDQLVYPRDVEELAKLRSQKEFVESHVQGELLGSSDGFEYLTLVRNPIEHAISNFRHILRDPGNRLHRPAKTLSVDSLFDLFGDFFADHQTRYLLSAFFPLDRKIVQCGRTRALHALLYAAVDKIRWLVPTEAADEFVTLWSIETERPVPNLSERVNVAPPDRVDIAAVRAALAARPHLFSFDALLYEIAKERFSAYKNSLYDKIRHCDWPNDSRRAYSADATGIYLRANWYDPETNDYGLAWWSGPTAVSEISIRRNAEQKYLLFDVNVVNGISHEDIQVRVRNEIKDIDISRSKTGADKHTYCVPIANFGEQIDLMLVVPNCFASIMTSPSDSDLVRRSYLSSNWRLAAAPTAGG